MQPARPPRRLDALVWLLAGLYVLDRLLKLLAVERFLRRPIPPAPDGWPSVSLLQPITRGASDLPGALTRRAALHYAGRLQHILICDAGDTESLALCQAWRAAHPTLDIEIVALATETSPCRDVKCGGKGFGDAALTQWAQSAASPTAALGARMYPQTTPTAVSTKVEKLQAGLRQASGAVLAFVDDDILLRPDAVAGLVRYLSEPRAGSTFGLAVYTDWSNVPSSLLSAFVNANALLAYLPLTFLVEPFTITGHFYALRREVFDTIGGLDGMAGRFDDDHELARRVQALGLVNVQTPVLYDVANHLFTLSDYANQMRRWAIIPKQTMAPFLTPRQQAASLLGSAGNLIPPLLGLLALMRGGGLRIGDRQGGKVRQQRGSPRPGVPSRSTSRPYEPLLGCLALCAAVYVWCERRWLGRRTPPLRWPLVLLSSLIAPAQALAALLHGDTFVWRGRYIQLQRGGKFKVID